MRVEWNAFERFETAAFLLDIYYSLTMTKWSIGEIPTKPFSNLEQIQIFFTHCQRTNDLSRLPNDFTSQIYITWKCVTVFPFQIAAEVRNANKVTSNVLCCLFSRRSCIWRGRSSAQLRSEGHAIPVTWLRFFLKGICVNVLVTAYVTKFVEN